MDADKDEMKMIEDNKRKETEFEAMTHFDDPSIPHICVIPSYSFGAETLYDANCRILADDEIVVKKSDYEALLLEQKRLKEIVDRIPCGYKPIGNEEVVISKHLYEQLKKHNADRKRLRLRWQQAKQETREILQEVVNAWNTGTLNQRELAYICTKCGIELE